MLLVAGVLAASLAGDKGAPFYEIVRGKARRINFQRKTYWLDFERFDDKDFRSIQRYIHSTRVLMLASKDKKGHWTKWLPTGELVRKGGYEIGSLLIDKAEPGVVYILSETASPEEGPRMLSDLATTYDVQDIDLGTPTTKVWGVLQDTKHKFANPQFVMPHYQPHGPDMEVKVGASIVIRNERFTITKVESGETSKVTMRRTNPQLWRSYGFDLIMAERGEEVEIDYHNSKPDKTGQTIVLTFDAPVEACKALHLSEKLEFRGVFGHVATRPIRR